MITIPQTLLLGTALIAITGCDAPPEMTMSQEAKKQAAKDALAPTPPATTFVKVTDPVEKAYTVSLPQGWHNRVYIARAYDVYTMVDISVSPNGSVLLFTGDPGLPQYWSPQHVNEATRFVAEHHPKMKIEPFQPATQYFPAYVRHKFGKLKNFKIASVEVDRHLLEKNRREFAQAGMQANVTTAQVAFSYLDNGKPMRALIIGASVDGGAFWTVNVGGITTSGDPKRYLEMVRKIDGSRRITRAWMQRQQQLHQQRMAQIEEFGRRMTAQHERNMAAIQDSAQRHQERMQAIWAQGDASMKSYYDRMASGDAQHRDFLNYINDESTVVGSNGKTYQVDNSYQRYFMHKRDRTYLGGDAHTTLDDLRRLSLNPDDYEEVKVKKRP